MFIIELNQNISLNYKLDSRVTKCQSRHNGRSSQKIINIQQDNLSLLTIKSMKTKTFLFLHFIKIVSLLRYKKSNPESERWIEKLCGLMVRWIITTYELPSRSAHNWLPVLEDTWFTLAKQSIALTDNCWPSHLPSYLTMSKNMWKLVDVSWILVMTAKPLTEKLTHESCCWQFTRSS